MKMGSGGGEAQVACNNNNTLWFFGTVGVIHKQMNSFIYFS
jgi:hypothetical protein